MNRIIGKFLRNRFEDFENWRSYTNSRKQAHVIHAKIIERKGQSILDRNLRKKIKEYANDVFGSKGYWPWLAVYTELRDRFIEGWIPDDYYRFELIQKMNPRPIAHLSKLKTFDHRLFNGFAIDPLAIKVSDQFYDKNMNRIDEYEFKEILSNYDDEVVIKRDSGASGKSQLFKQAREVSYSNLKNKCDFVVQPVIKQNRQLNELYPNSVNTIRVATYLGINGSVSLKYIYLRFGMHGSRVDNAVTGGGYVYLNQNGNVISDAFDNYGNNIGQNHPDTEFVYKELKVPSVNEAIERCYSSHILFPYVKFIAWDVCIDQNNKPGLIEWNARLPSMWPNEALIGPLWKEETL